MKKCSHCGCPLLGTARKYCPTCKRKAHLEQMNLYYINNTKFWQYGGKYWDQQRHNKFGTGSLGSHALPDHDKEYRAIQKELRNLQLRDKKEHWRYKP